MSQKGFDPSVKLMPASVAEDFTRICLENGSKPHSSSSGPVQYPGQIHQVGSLSGPGKKKRK